MTSTTCGWGDRCRTLFIYPIGYFVKGDLRVNVGMFRFPQKHPMALTCAELFLDRWFKYGHAILVGKREAVDWEDLKIRDSAAKLWMANTNDVRSRVGSPSFPQDALFKALYFSPLPPWLRDWSDVGAGDSYGYQTPSETDMKQHSFTLNVWCRQKLGKRPKCVADALEFALQCRTCRKQVIARNSGFFR